MSERSARSKSPAYELDVFINCPFDEAYLPMFHGLVFAVYACGLRPRSAQEVADAGEVRIEKIARIVRDCRWGIHDISRTELNVQGLPRFNMPLELGLFLGARRFGSGIQKRKSCLVLDRQPYRYQAFISDIAGQDIAAHGEDVHKAIKAVRDWLATERAGIARHPGGAAISEKFSRFSADLPSICAETDRRAEELTFTEFADAASTWLRVDLGMV
jgi:hypothetical protein